jgi:hypothetical protein
MILGESGCVDLVTKDSLMMVMRLEMILWDLWDILFIVINDIEKLFLNFEEVV